MAGRYRTIVADPPWDHSDGTGVDVSTGCVTTLAYPTMDTESIAALPVRDLADNRAGDCHLYLWTTSRYLPQSFSIARAWGFHYRAVLVWCKASRGFSTGGHFQNNVEFIVCGRLPGFQRRADILALTSALADAADARGLSRREIDLAMGTTDMAGWWLSRIEYRCACPSAEQWPRLKAVLGVGDELDALVGELNGAKGERRAPYVEQATSRWFTWPRGSHSAKPEAFLDIVEQVSPGPRVELFARRQRLGWDTWGDEALCHVDLASPPHEATP